MNCYERDIVFLSLASSVGELDLDGDGQQFVLWVLVEQTECWGQRKRVIVDGPGGQAFKPLVVTKENAWNSK